MFKYIVLFFVLLISSCRVGDEYQPAYQWGDDEFKNELKITDKQEVISNDWYTIFNDKILNMLIKKALNNNFTIKAGIERLIQARYALSIQSKQFFPMIDGMGNYQFSKNNNLKNYLTDANAFKIGFDAAWEIDIWGKGNYISEQYYEMMKSAEYSLLNIKTTITAEIVLDYIKLREAEKKLYITEKNLRLQKDILQTIKDKHLAGIADDLALNQAEYVVEETRASIPLLQNQIEVYKNALAVLSGVLPSKLSADLKKNKNDIVAHTFKYTVKNLYNLPLSIIRSRPDVIVAESKIKEQNAIVNGAIVEMYPDLNLSASFAYVSHSANKLFNTKNQIYGYTPGINLPIWHWNQLKNNVELQKHIREEYVLNYNETILSTLTEIKNAIMAVEQAYSANEHQKNSFYKMQNIMSLTNEKYKNGLVDFTDVANAEQNLLAAQLAMIESNAEILQYLTAFYKATGGGYNLYH